MNIQTTDLILILILLAVALFLLYLIVKLVSTRPDIVAVLSISCMLFGLVFILLGHNAENGLMFFGAGGVGLMLAMLTHGRQNP